jgi:Suppressor of fused protein (SUFU)
MRLPDHLERFLGIIRGGWTKDADGRKMPFSVVEFANGPRPNTATFSTLGLSKMPLHAETALTHVYQELVIVVPDWLRVGPVPGILQQIGQEAIRSGRAVLRGDVIGPRGPLFSADSKMEALYATNPVCFPDEFASYRAGDRDVVLVWLMPISRNEAEYVRAHGWSRFEEELVKADLDLTDLLRRTLFG